MSQIRCYEGPAPSTPPAGVVTLYAKTDGRWYFKADDGVEIPLKPVGVGSGDLLSDGTVPLSANWNAVLSITGYQWTSTATTGTAPFVVSSTTLVANLNADLLDGQEGTYYENAALASQAEAEAGVEATKTMTPLRTAQAIAVLASGILNNYNATVPPTADDDAVDGYSAGSYWIDQVADEVYRCIDPTAASAVWVKTTLSTDELAAVAVSGDSDDLIEGSTNLLLTTAERTKLTGIDPNASLKSNLTATAAPTVTDDSGSGYAVGSKWCDETNDKIYFCLDASVGAAIWQEVGSGTGGGGGMTVTTVKTAAYTASSNEFVLVDTTGGPVTITLPASPSAQDRIIICDVGHAAGTFNITIARNGKNIVGVAEDFVIDQDEGRWDGSYDGTDNWDAHVIGAPSIVNVNDFVTGFSSVNDQTGTTYTFTESDLVNCAVANNAAASTYSIPDSLGDVGDTLNLYNKGAGVVTIDMAGTDTLNTTANDCAQYKAVTALKIAATVWAVVGGS